jgi:hypothetical protein
MKTTGQYAKDPGTTAVLCPQHSKERREKDLSVMTFYLLEYIRDSEGRFSVQDAYEYVRPKVEAYTEKNFRAKSTVELFSTPTPTEERQNDVLLEQLSPMGVNGRGQSAPIMNGD